MKEENSFWKGKYFCEKCKKSMTKKVFNINGFKIRGFECRKCGENILSGQESNRMLIFNKLQKGIPVKVGKLANSLIVRIPKEITEFYCVKKGKNLILKAEDDNNFKIEVAS